MQLSQSVPPHGWRSSFAAASTTLDTRAAMVMGPTPPGTGVMADATDATSSVTTSPTTRKPASASDVRSVGCRPNAPPPPKTSSQCGKRW